MPRDVKLSFLDELHRKYGSLKKLPNSQSLFEFAGGAGIVYIRYSKPHPGGRTFYGLRQLDLLRLSGRPAIIAFLWDDQVQPLTIPFADYEEVFHSVQPASDGQYKVQVYHQDSNAELYIAQAGRFNVEGNFGWDAFQIVDQTGEGATIPNLSHSQVQTLLGAIGVTKGFDISRM